MNNPRTTRINRLILGLTLCASFTASAAVTQTAGVGSAVTHADRWATFNSITTGTGLSTYTEGLLSVTSYRAADETYDYFRGHGEGHAFQWHGESGGMVEIKTTDGCQMVGVEFIYGNGFGSGYPPPYQYGLDSAVIGWLAFKGSKQYWGSFSVPVGTVVGFKDSTGFDRLLVTAVNGPTENAIALDNLRVQLVGGIQPVPEPSTYLAGLGAVGILGAFCWRNRRPE